MVLIIDYFNEDDRAFEEENRFRDAPRDPPESADLPGRALMQCKRNHGVNFVLVPAWEGLAGAESVEEGYPRGEALYCPPDLRKIHYDFMSMSL